MSKSDLTIEKLEELLERKFQPLRSKIDDLQPLKDKIDELHKSVGEMAASLSFLSDKYDELNLKVERLEEEKRETTEESTRLKQEIFILSRDLATQRDIVDNFEQYSRRDCLEIRGIPVSKPENTDKIIRDLGSMIGVDIQDDDISTSHRLPVRDSGDTNRDPAIIVKFVRRHVRDAFYKAKKNLKDKTSKDLGFLRTQERKIYVSESLTQKNKQLFKRTYKAKMNLGIRFIWTRQGKIFLRADDNSPVIPITNEKDLDLLHRRSQTPTHMAPPTVNHTNG